MQRRGGYTWQSRRTYLEALPHALLHELGADTVAYCIEVAYCWHCARRGGAAVGACGHAARDWTGVVRKRYSACLQQQRCRSVAAKGEHAGAGAREGGCGISGTQQGVGAAPARWLRVTCCQPASECHWQCARARRARRAAPAAHTGWRAQAIPARSPSPGPAAPQPAFLAGTARALGGLDPRDRRSRAVFCK